MMAVEGAVETSVLVTALTIAIAIIALSQWSVETSVLVTGSTTVMWSLSCTTLR